MNQAATVGAQRTGLTNIEVLDTSRVLDGRRLCENTVGLLEERGVANWQTPGAVDVTEWVSQIRTATTVFGPYQLQESVHPSYWGHSSPCATACVRRSTVAMCAAVCAFVRRTD